MDISVFPNTIDYWGPPGMVFVRNPQFRITPFKGQSMTVAVSLEAPNSVIDTGKVTDVDPALGAGIASRNRFPDLGGVVPLRGRLGPRARRRHCCARWAFTTRPVQTASRPTKRPAMA